MVERSILTAKKTAFISFSIGTMLFLLYQLSLESLTLIYIGFAYTLGAIIVNSIVILHLLYLLISFPKELKKLLLTCFVVLANIPIAITYLYFTLSPIFPKKG